MSFLSSRSSRTPMQHRLTKGSAPSSLSLNSRAPSITLEKKAPSRAQHSRQRKPSLPRRVRSLEDRIQPFVTITLGEATKGSGAPDEILTYRYVKPRVQWFSKEEDPPTDPFRIARGLCPSGTLACPLWQRDPAKPDSTTAFAWGSGASPSLGLLIYVMTKPGPWLLPD
jgi:hypothetical protein